MALALQNNKACALVKRNCAEGAIDLLNQVLTTLSDFQQRRPHLEPTTPCPHPVHTNRDYCHDEETSHLSQHYNPEHHFDEGMTTHSEPIFICEEPVHTCHDCHDRLIDEATVLFNMGIAYSRTRNNSKALKYFVKSLGNHQQQFDASNQERVAGPSLHTIYQNIGHLYWREKRFEEAVSAYQVAIDSLSNGHDDAHCFEKSSSLNCIAIAKLSGGDGDADVDADEILALFNRAIALVENHPKATHDRNMATIINNKARVKYLKGDYSDALNLYEEAHKRRVAILGADHIDVAGTLFGIAQAKVHLDRIPEAISACEQFTSIMISKRGEGSKEIVGSFLLISELYRSINMLDDAQRFLSQAMDVAILAHGPNHSIVANIMNGIADIFRDQGSYDLALQSYQSVLAMERVVYSSIDVKVAATAFNIAQILYQQDRLDEAAGMFWQALRIKESANKQQIVTNLSNLGYIHDSMGRLDEAARAWNESIVLLRELHHDTDYRDPVRLSSLLNALGVVEYKRGSFIPAIRLFLEAIKIRRSCERGRLHDILGASFNAVTVYRSIWEIDEALGLDQEILLSEQLNEISQSIHDCQEDQEDVGVDITSSGGDHQHHEDIIILHREIGNLQRGRGDFDDALRSLQRASRMCVDHAASIDRNEAHKTFMSLADLQSAIGNTNRAMESYLFAATQQQQSPAA